MRLAKLNSMSRGWFIGNFVPSVVSTDEVEVAVKHYQKDDREDWHFHRVASEITVIISGEVIMNGYRFLEGDIIYLEPGEGTDFQAVSDTVTVVVKMPSAADDKFPFGTLGGRQAILEGRGNA